MGASKAIASAVIIECEVEFVPLYKEQPLFGDIQILLRERGFVLHKFLDIAGRSFRPANGPGGNPFTAMSQVLWADAIFVRDFFGSKNSMKVNCSKPPRSCWRRITRTTWCITCWPNMTAAGGRSLHRDFSKAFCLSRIFVLNT